jgi:hypothetical protein
MAGDPIGGRNVSETGGGIKAHYEITARWTFASNAGATV